MTNPIDDFDAILDAAEAKERETVELDVVLGDTLVSFEFIQMPGEEYADLIAMHPPREDAKVDAGIGFNTYAVAKDLPAKYIRRIVDGEKVAVTDTQWARAFARFSGRDTELAGTCVWGVNFYTPNERVKQLKKDSAGTSPKKRS